MRGRGVQAEVLVSLALVMVTATGLLAAFFLETHAQQTARMSGWLGRALSQEAGAHPFGPEVARSEAQWFLVPASEPPRALHQTLAELDEAGIALAEEARTSGAALLRTGAPWQPIRFAMPRPGLGGNEIAVAVVPAAVPPLVVLGLLVADCAVFTILGLWLLRRRVVLPLRHLSEAARSIADGGPGARVAVEGVSEAAEVARAFNEMSESLERRDTALEKAVTELRAANKSLRRARDGLDNAERLAAVGHLAAGVAHEVGNPMGALIAFLDLVGRDDSLSDPTRRHVDRALEQGERVRSILRQLLDFSRPPRAARGDVDLAALAEQSAGLVRAQKEYADVAIDVQRAEGTPPALADESLVAQILLNLVLNAADAVERHGRVRLELRPAPLLIRAGDDRDAARARRATDGVEVVVADDGPGVHEEDLSCIFDPFFTTKPPGSGTGLGLANALRLAEELGGSLEYLPGHPLGGAAFVLRLPAAGPGEALVRTPS